MELNESTFLIYATKYYDIKKSEGPEEFYEDLKRFQYLKRIFKRYDDVGEINVRLALNHIVVIYNCFGSKATDLLFLKLEPFKHILVPFLIFLNMVPNMFYINKKKFILSDISLDPLIVQELRKI